MSKKVLIPCCALLTFSLVGCVTTINPSTERNLDHLKDKNWVVSEIQGEKLVADSSKSNVPSIRFDSERVSGTDGCNRFMGGYTVKGTEIQLSKLASTEMACLNASDTPKKFSQALQQVTQYDASDKELKLLDASKKVLLKFDAAQ